MLFFSDISIREDENKAKKEVQVNRDGFLLLVERRERRRRGKEKGKGRERGRAEGEGEGKETTPGGRNTLRQEHYTSPHYFTLSYRILPRGLLVCPSAIIMTLLSPSYSSLILHLVLSLC